MKPRSVILPAALAVLLLAACGRKESGSAIRLLNVSYDPTREFYADINRSFAAHWEREHGGRLEVTQSHGGSGKQARAVIDGLEADIVTLALAGDIDMLHKEADLLAADWQGKLPHNSSPYTSTIVFVVRKGNPKGIRDWGDLVRDGVQVITPNPKTSGGARWNYLAAWAWAEKAFGRDEARILEYMAALFRNVPVLDSGARGSTTTFAQRGIGDVFLSWENEAWLIEKEFPGQTAIVYPSRSILAEPPVAVLTANTRRRGTEEAAAAYLEFLYSPEAQELAGRHFYRPRLAEAAAKFADRFPSIAMAGIDADFGGWAAAQKKHFDDGGTFDRIYRK